MKITETELQQLLDAMASKNLTILEVIDLIHGKIKKNTILQSTNDEIKFIVDYTKTLEQAIADGKYDYKDSDITAKNFPISPEMIGKKVDIAARLFRFDRDISSHDVIKEIDNDGCRPAALMELLALVITNPDLQRQFPIIAFGSTWQLSVSRYVVPGIGMGDFGRELSVGSLGGDWSRRCRFLGVCK